MDVIKKEEITTVGSCKRAQRLISEIISNGGYKCTGIREGFALYTRKRDDNTELIYIERVNARLYRINKEVRETKETTK